MAKLEITKQVPLSKQLLAAAEKRIEQLGVKFPEYIRHLIIQDTNMMSGGIEYVTKQEEFDIAASLRDVKRGRVQTMKTDEEIDEYVDNLLD